jgi:Tol biopolymer transport system component
MRQVLSTLSACLSVILLSGDETRAELDNEERLLTNLRQLTFEGRRAGEGYFSADGRQIIFQSEREKGNPFYQMYVMDLSTGDVKRVSPGYGKTTCGWIHPRGDKALFASTHDDPNAKDKQKTELEKRAAGERRRYAWSYDEHYDIQEVELDSGVYRNLTRTLGYDAEGAYSPDGKQIVFASNRAAYARSLDATEKEIFEKDKSYFMDLYIMDADGSNVRQLTRAPGYDGGPFFSANGAKIVWRRFSEDGARAEVYTMNVDGSNKRQITRVGAMSWAPFFHPSGDYIIFATNLHGYGNFELYLVDAEGQKEPVRVTQTEGFDGLPTFSPSGKTLSWSSNRTADGTTQIFIADWDDAEARKLLGLQVMEATDRALESHRRKAPGMQRTEAPIKAADLRWHLEALASDQMDGRLTGTEGEAKAADYVAEAFAAIGLEPEGDDGNYLQRFSFTAGVSLGPNNKLILTTKSGERVLEFNREWRPLAFSGTGESGPAPVTFAGFGIVAPADGRHEAYDSYAGLNIADKWVLVFRGVPQGVSSERRLHLTRYADLRYKASVARAKGARGLIVAPAPGITYKDPLVRLSYEASTGTSSLPSLSVTGAVASAMLAPAGIDTEALYDRLDNGETTHGLAIAGMKVASRIDLAFVRRNGLNVLARLRTGASSNVPPLIIGAHLDHLGRGQTSGSLARPDEQRRIHPGADDNASGVSALIEIAQWLAADYASGRLKARRDILFAAWSGEELGLLGSSHFVRDLANRRGREKLSGVVSAYLNMDMIGRLRHALYLFGLGSSSVWKREIERRNIPVGLSIVTSGDTYLPTDATSFYLKDVPILHAFTGTHKEYSTPRDTVDRINYPGLQKVARFMALVARSQAESEKAPDFIKQEKPRGSGARRVSTVYLGTIPDYAAEGIIGVPITGVMNGGPAEKAGLKGGDVIVGLGGNDIQNIYDYVRAINGLRVGTPTSLVVQRKGARVILSLTPAPRE